MAMFGVQTGYNKIEQKYINHLILIGKMCISMIKAAFHPCVNVYIYKPINRWEWKSYVPLGY